MSLNDLLARRLMARVTRRPPDFIIGGTEDPYLLRWWVIPRNPVFNVYLHCFLRSDDDRALHTHPWLFNLSWLLLNRYREWLSDDTSVVRSAGDVKFRWGPAPHRVELFRAVTRRGEPIPCWTLFITGPRVRQWGFLCPKGFIHWKRFTAADDAGAVGKGCDA
ncbi:hypothetical protein J7E62_27575 [Variovorax paradoxus]|nr:hypothetical protein [Variovorax paradoxus]